MKYLIVLVLSLFISQSLWATEPTAEKKQTSCEIQAGWFDCFPSLSEYDYGCSVNCGTRTAVCKPADGFPNLDPGHPGGGGYTRCNFFPSTCYCK